jgi:hypothetical protein
VATVGPPRPRSSHPALGSGDPALDAAIASHATIGRLSDLLWQRVPPTRAEIDRIADFCVRGVTVRQARSVT